jgi:hypothetical protein
VFGDVNASDRQRLPGYPSLQGIHKDSFCRSCFDQ